jgi:hypothetical protein
VGESSGWGLPFQEGEPFALDLNMGVDMQLMHTLNGLSGSSDVLSTFPLLEPNTNAQRPSDNPLAVFSQLLGINHNHTTPYSGQGNRPSPRNGQRHHVPSPTWPRDAHLLTPTQPTLDNIFSPTTTARRRVPSFHESPDGNPSDADETPNGQDDRLEEGTSSSRRRIHALTYAQSHPRRLFARSRLIRRNSCSSSSIAPGTRRNVPSLRRRTTCISDRSRRPCPPGYGATSRTSST